MDAISKRVLTKGVIIMNTTPSTDGWIDVNDRLPDAPMECYIMNVNEGKETIAFYSPREKTWAPMAYPFVHACVHVATHWKPYNGKIEQRHVDNITYTTTRERNDFKETILLNPETPDIIKLRHIFNMDKDDLKTIFPHLYYAILGLLDNKKNQE